MPHDNFTYNHLPYGEYAQSAYDGIQNIYGNTLDKAYDSVGNFFSSERAQEFDAMGNAVDPNAGTIFSKEAIENRAEWNNADEFPNSFKMAPPRNYTEAEMGSSPYQETDTGPGLMMSGGPMARGGNRSRSVTNPNYDAPGSYYYQDPDDAKTQAMLNLRSHPMKTMAAGQRNGPVNYPDDIARFVTRPIAQKYMDANDGTPMTYNEFSEYVDRRESNNKKPQSDWAKWKASMNSGRS